MTDSETSYTISSAVPQAQLRLQMVGKKDMAMPNPAREPAPQQAVLVSTLARPVYCVLGMPIDAVDLATVVNSIEGAAANRTILLVSTPNLNFLATSLSDTEFRESLLHSDLCIPDGAPIVWVARLLGLPIKKRVAGSDLLDRLRAPGMRKNRLSIFLFGGAKGVAAAAASALNAEPNGLICVGAMDPGFREVSEMSQDHIVDAINSSGADFLSVSLGAKKGQLWLYRNHKRLAIPIRAHLGAAINFQAGIIRRAPPILRNWGLEWLWRIKEEHHLWKRYLNDGLLLLRLLLTRVLPLAMITVWHRFRQRQQRQGLLIGVCHDDQSIIINLCGFALEKHVREAIACFEQALTGNRNITIDLSSTRLIDGRFLGLFLMLRKELRNRKATLIFTGASRAIKRIFKLNELEFLLSPGPPD